MPSLYRARLGLRVAGVAAAAALLAGCGAGNGLTADPNATGPSLTTVVGLLPHPAHVVVVIFENKADAQVIGTTAAPYLSALASTGTTFTASHGIAHPSQPNYVALLSGSTYGVTDDSCPQNLGTKPNLAQELLKAGDSFAGFAEAMPTTGFTGCSASGGSYARKHNPWVDFSNIPASSNRPYADFPQDLSTLPTVSFVVPNLCHDMHDCSVSAGDRWARPNLAPYVSWAHTHNSLLIVTFDEDDGSAANHIPTFLVGPMVRAGQVNQSVDHYNLLRTLEDMYRLRPLGHAASARPLTGWNT
ncbi:MAG: alkaline phosphatase family protein [Terracoccus sp.]